MTGLTDTQIALIRVSYAAAMRRSDGLAAIFYHRLFLQHPFIRALFSDDLAAQEYALTATLDVIVDSLHELASMLPLLGQLAKRHVGYGVRREHYAIIGAVLIDTFAEVLDDRFTAETRTAWEEAYAILSRNMIAAAYGRGPVAERSA